MWGQHSWEKSANARLAGAQLGPLTRPAAKMAPMRQDLRLLREKCSAYPRDVVTTATVIGIAVGALRGRMRSIGALIAAWLTGVGVDAEAPPISQEVTRAIERELRRRVH